MHPAIHPPQPPHAALLWLIRGTGIFIAGLAATIAIYFLGHCIVGAFRGETGTLGWIGVLLVILITTVVMGLFFKIGCDMFRRLDVNTVANFAFTFSILISVAFYHSLPAHPPQVVIDYFGNNPFFVPFRDQGSHPANPSYRAVLSYLVCFIFYKLIKAYLLQTLDLNPSNPPKNPPPDSWPDGSETPFNPYDLSKNSPIRPR